MVNMVPFQYFEKSGECYCPKCAEMIGESDKIRRIICNGGVRKMWMCPNREHFHRSCPHCGGKWNESTFESDLGEISSTVKSILKSFLRLNREIDEDEIVKIWREVQVKDIMDG